MKAAVMHEFGGPEVLRYEDIATPKPGPEHVLLKVLAAGVNRLDHYVREGSVTRAIPLPHVLGIDAVGEIVEVGDGVAGLQSGQRVIPVPGFPLDEAEADVRPAVTASSFALPGLGFRGTYAQYFEVPARWLVQDETGLPPEAAATLPLVLTSGTRAVRTVGAVKAGDTVLMQAGGSGSGSVMIQIAKALGASVAATVRDDVKGRLATSAGADLVINARQDDVVARIKDWTDGRGADVVIDNLGGAVLAQSIEAAKPLGVVVAYGFAAGPDVSFDIRSLFFPQKQLRGTMSGDLEDLRWGLAQVAAGRIRPTLDRALPLSAAAEAHRLIAANRVAGNLALLPWAG